MPKRESTLTPELRQAFLLSLKNRLNELENIEEILKKDRTKSSDVPLHVQFRFELQMVSELSVLAHKLQHHPEKWHQKVEKIFYIYKKKLTELKQYDELINLTATYGRYLIERNDLEGAINIAHFIETLNPFFFADPQSTAAFHEAQHIEREKNHLLIQVSAVMIEHGKLRQAQQLAEQIDLSRYGREYFLALFHHYKKNNDIDNIYLLNGTLLQMANMLQNDEEGNDDDWRELEFVRCVVIDFLSNNALKKQETAEVLSLFDSMLFSRIRLEKHIEAVEKLLVQNCVGEAEELIKKIVMDLEQNTENMESSEISDFDDGTFGSLAFLPQREFEYTQQTRIELLTQLLQALSKHNQARKFLESCLHGSGDWNTKGLLQHLEELDEKKQAEVWASLMCIATHQKDLGKLEQLYKEGLQRFPHAQDLLDSQFAIEMYSFDPVKSLELTMKLSPTEKVVAYAMYCYRNLSKDKLLKTWRFNAHQLYQLENTVVNSRRREGLTWFGEQSSIIEPQSAILIEKNAQISFLSETVFHTVAPQFLCQVAERALDLGDVAVFEQVMKDPRMSISNKTAILYTATEQLMN